MAGQWKVAGRPHAARAWRRLLVQETRWPQAARFAPRLDLIQKHNAPATGEPEDPIRMPTSMPRSKTPSAEQTQPWIGFWTRPRSADSTSGCMVASLRKSSFLAFFLSGRSSSWEVPDIHIRACHWLEHREKLPWPCCAAFAASVSPPSWRPTTRGGSGMTRRINPASRATKMERHSKPAETRKPYSSWHPWTAEWFSAGARGEASFWWCPGADDERNPTMQAAMASLKQHHIKPMR